MRVPAASGPRGLFGTFGEIGTGVPGRDGGWGLKLALVGIHEVAGEQLPRVADPLLRSPGSDPAGRTLLGGFEKELGSMATAGLAVRDLEPIGTGAMQRWNALESNLQKGSLEDDLVLAMLPPQKRTDADVGFVVEALDGCGACPLRPSGSMHRGPGWLARATVLV